MKDFSDYFYAVRSGEISAEVAAKKIAKNRKLWPNKENEEYKFLYSNYPESRDILEKIWI
ncbi:MAG: hypothetical protein KDC70_00340 [Saprospiraceae bacterium]|nr:hypothetical protein [Saprospiraceae bacterium]